MLERVSVEIDVLIEIVGIRKKVVVERENVGGRYVEFGQEQTFRVAGYEDVVVVVKTQVFALFVP